jgi:hypothetical protein
MLKEEVWMIVGTEYPLVQQRAVAGKEASILNGRNLQQPVPIPPDSV